MRARDHSIQHLLSGSEARLGLRRVICEKGLRNRLRHVHIRHCVYEGPDGPWGPRLIQALTLSKRHAGAHPVFLEDIRSENISCIFISAGDAVTDGLCHFAEQAGIPLLASAHDAFLLESRLRGVLREKINQHRLVHGVLLRMFGRGVLIQGDSGAGKTSAGVTLARRGHTWIADDAIEIIKRRGQRLYARGCKSTRDLIDLKESGVQKAQRLLTGCRLAQGTDLHLILEMKRRGSATNRRISQSDPGAREIMGIQVPCIRIPSLRDDHFDLLKVEERVKAFMAEGGAS